MTSAPLIAIAAQMTGSTDTDVLIEKAAEMMEAAQHMDSLLDGLKNPECKHYVETVLNVTRITKGEGEFAGQKARIVYSEHERRTGNMVDPGWIETDWLDNPLAMALAKRAKQSIGQRCVFHKLNVGHTDDQPSGYRQLLWLDPLGPRSPRQSNYAEPRQQAAPAPPAYGQRENHDAHAEIRANQQATASDGLLTGEESF